MTPEQENFLIVFENSLGIVMTACEKFDISRKTYYNWRDSCEEFATACDRIKEQSVDFSESKLFELINGVTSVKYAKKEGEEDVIYDIPPNANCVMFHLKTIGKKRGYVEKTEVDTTEVKKLTVNIRRILPDGSRD
jgi:hypothetical protein